MWPRQYCDTAKITAPLHPYKQQNQCEVTTRIPSTTVQELWSIFYGWSIPKSNSYLIFQSLTKHAWNLESTLQVVLWITNNKHCGSHTWASPLPHTHTPRDFLLLPWAFKNTAVPLDFNRLKCLLHFLCSLMLHAKQAKKINKGRKGAEGDEDGEEGK